MRSLLVCNFSAVAPGQERTVVSIFQLRSQRPDPLGGKGLPRSPPPSATGVGQSPGHPAADSFLQLCSMPRIPRGGGSYCEPLADTSLPRHPVYDL